MSRVVVFSASPRKKGNTRRVLEEYLEKRCIAEWSHFELADLQIGHCIGCLHCFRTGECFQRDDMDRLYQAADEADCLIFTSPVYFNSVTSIGKTVIDRFQRNYARRFIRSDLPKVEPHKTGVLIMTAGSREKNQNFDGARKPMDLFFKSNGIVGFEEILVEGLDHVKY